LLRDRLTEIILITESRLDNSPYADRRLALTPQPPLPQGEGEQDLIIFLFPSPAGEGLGVRALLTFCVT